MYACNVKSFVYYEHHSKDYIVEHSHNCYECVFYMEGKGTITADKEVSEYDGSTITIVSPSTKHDEKTETFTRLFIILFEAEKGLLSKPFYKLKLTGKTHHAFLELFNKMQDEEKEKRPLYKDVVNYYFSLILCNFFRNISSTRESPDKELVSRIKAYIKENYNQDVDFVQIATSFGYSYDRFRHIFQKETGTPIHQYILNCKLYAAKQMLLFSAMPVKDIAVKCGFNSNIHFNNFFKKKMSISPQQFRKFSLNPIDVGVFKIDNGKKQAKKLFIDTDIGADCDDAGALAIANILKNNGFIDILGITYTTSSKWGPACIDSIDTYFGNGDIEIGTTSRQNYCENINEFQRVLATEFLNGIYNNNTGELKKVDDAVILIRRKLAKTDDKSVTFVCIGQLDNISDLLDSPADEYSALNGIELVKRKVKEFVVMGGLFKEKDEKIMFYDATCEVEYNIACDIVSAQNFVDKCPVKVVFCDFKVGYRVFTGKMLLDQNSTQNPVTVAYKLFNNKPRESWDPLTMWYAVFGLDDLFELSHEGNINIDDKGNTVFDDSIKNNRYIIRLGNSIEYTQNKLDEVFLGGDFCENQKI